ncbi:MAG: type III polyketide synthase [Ignavibacteriae bacterium]|nr:type III polyketide synthase [Ignavibacteriota bacterium]MCB9214508.1 type III polyketide synthase [Ignavibacteria bacterium]
MSTISAVGTAVPEHILYQDDVKEFARELFGDVFPAIDRLVSAYDNAQIDRRHFCVPISWFAEQHSFREKNDLYVANAIKLSKEAIATCLEKSLCSIEEIDYILFVSTTGLATPSIDARLIEELPFRRDVKRLPIWGLGCAGGAASLSRAMEMARAVPTARILIVVVELCGLTFVKNDLSKANLIASALFGDGAAAVLVEGDEAEGKDRGSLELLASQTRTLPDSLDVMGWDISERGFGITISRDIPTIVHTFMRESIQGLLSDNGLEIEQIDHYITHPGGAKVLEAYQESLNQPREKFAHTWEILRNFGNMSAASVLFVLEKFIEEIETRRAGEAKSTVEYGLIGALGPGFSSELLLTAWK